MATLREVSGKKARIAAQVEHIQARALADDRIAYTRAEKLRLNRLFADYCDAMSTERMIVERSRDRFRKWALKVNPTRFEDDR